MGPQLPTRLVALFTRPAWSRQRKRIVYVGEEGESDSMPRGLEAFENAHPFVEMTREEWLRCIFNMRENTFMGRSTSLFHTFVIAQWNG